MGNGGNSGDGELGIGKRSGSSHHIQMKTIFTILALGCVMQAQLWTGVVAPSRAINWANVGIPGGLPDASWTQCGSTLTAATYGGSSSSPANASAITSVISGCAAQTYVQLGAGTFYLTGAIALKNQVVIRGAGANATFLVMYNNGSGTCNGQYTAISLCGDSNYYLSPENSATWTAGFSQGATSITLSNSLNIVAGRSTIILDQQDLPTDTGNIWVCAQISCGGDGSGGIRTSGTCSSSVSPNVGFCTEQQMVLVTACSPSCNNSGSTVVTISPGLYAPNWNPANSTGAWWATTQAYQEGVEDMSIDLSNLTASTSCVTGMNAYEIWVEGIRCIDGGRSHISFWGVSHGLVLSNYFYENLSHATQSYGLELFEASSDNLVMNNIFQQVTDSTPSNTSGGAGNVAAYNFAVEDVFASAGWFQPSDYAHSGGDFYWLREGNETLGLESDDIHGTHNLTTLFRNRYPGWQSYGCGGAAVGCSMSPGQTGNSSAILMQAASRYFNLIGNVVGQANYHSMYQTIGSAPGTQNYSAFYLGGVYGGNGTPNPGFCSNATCSSYVTNDDPLTSSSVMRWGNWDSVTAGCSTTLACATTTVRWCGNSSDPGWSTTCGSTSETASSFGDTTGTPSIYVNPVPGSTTLPNSFFLTASTTSSCGTGLSWWKNPGTATCPPFPTTGPDVSGGNIGTCSGGTYADSYAISNAQCTGGGTLVAAFGGHANANPAMSCYLSIMNGPPDGTGNVLSFNRASCYANDPSSQAVAPTASPTSGAVPQTVTVANPNSGTTVVCYNFTGSPATNGDGATCHVGSTPYTTSLTISVPETLYIIAGTSTLTDSSINSYTYTGTTPAVPTFSPGAGTYSATQTVTISTVTGGAIICYNTTGSPATNGSTGCTTGTLYTGPVTVSSSETLYAVAGGTGYTDSSVGSAAYTITLLSFAVLNPTSLTFPSTIVGANSAIQIVVLSNTGGATLNIASQVVSGDYAIIASGGSCSTTLAAGGSCNIRIRFTPTTTGTRTGTLTVTDDSGGVPGSTQTASLTGTGVSIINGLKLTTGIKLTRGIALNVSGSGSSSCGPPLYSCFNQTTSVVNLANPIPSWGSNTCNSSTIYTIATCGNLIGAGTAFTPNDFNNTGIRVTDVNTNGNPNTIWETADDPGVGLWNTDDSGFLGHVNSGSFFVFSFNGSAATLVTPNISFSGAVTFSNVSNNKVYSMGSTSAVLQQNVINFSTGGVTTTNLFDYSGTNCLTNPVNGYTGGAFNVTWNGQLSTDLTDNTFAMGFSNTGGQGTGQYMAVWQRGQVGCDLWRTDNGTITHNGISLGSVSNAQWGGANGGLADFSLIHDEATTLNPNYVNIGFTQNAFIQGTYSVGPYLWQVGTTNIVHCGIGAPNWVASHAYSNYPRVNPLLNNTGDYIYQIVSGSGSGTSGSSEPNPWNQTVGGTQIDGTITWQNVGLGTSSGAQYNCDGHGWKGATGVGVGKNVTYHSFANPAVPLLGTVPTAVTSITDTHLGATNGNISDTTWPLDVSTDVGTTVNQLGTLPAALYNEMFLVSPPWQSPGVQNCIYNAITCPGGTLQQLRRAHHTFNSGWAWSFDTVQAVCVISQTGKYDLCATDGLGQFGNRSGAPSCNIGGPDWNASDSTDYSVGELVYPQSANGGDYIYKIQSCSGTCTTGSAHPTWVQSSTVAGVGTFTDGTITWQGAPDINTSTNTAVQNCRSDLVVWKLYR